MPRKRWYAYSGLLQRRLSSSTEITSTVWELYNPNTGEIAGTYATREELTAAQTANSALLWRQGFTRARQIQSTETTPAVSKGVALVPLTPLPVFTRPGKVLTTRGFWDVVSTSQPSGPVSNFAFGMRFLPTKIVYDQVPIENGTAIRYDLSVGDFLLPDPLLDDAGWFCYDSFVRVTTDVNQDPPFHSKTQKRFSENSVLCVIAAVEVAVENLQSLRLDFGIRFRILVEH